jgi:7,8-dihydropterin-6-yl-methyl-4-(beta-D-ribofuranosyl)aminobenzene 5'-phosphate synthase
MLLIHRIHEPSGNTGDRLAGHHSLRGGRAEPDPLILDERFVAAIVRGRGITVLSACSHAGVVNACLAAQRQFP